MLLLCLTAETLAQFGAAPPSRCKEEALLDDKGVREVTLQLRRSIAMKLGAALHHLSGEPWDLCVVGFKEAHCASHLLWDLVDAAHPGFVAGRDELLGCPVATILADLDQAIGALVAAAGPDAEVVVFSTTEMVANGTADHLIAEVARRVSTRLGESALETRLRRAFGRPSRCELLPYNENCAALRINMRGQQAIEEVAALLAELEDAEGGRAFEEISLPSTTSAGRRAKQLPDLLVHYRVGRVPRAIQSARLGRIEAEPPALRAGNHAPGLCVITAGPNGDPGAPHSIEDFGPYFERRLAANDVKAASTP